MSAMAGNDDGLFANRSRGPFGTDLNLMVEAGARFEQVDKVMVDFGYPIGLFATADLSGLDIGYDSRQRRATQDANHRKMPIADMIVEMGRLGRRPALVGSATRRATAPRPPQLAQKIGEGRRTRHPATELHRRGDPPPAVVCVGQ
jgi:3-hydroxyacyl-CoA dehydrogenase